MRACGSWRSQRGAALLLSVLLVVVILSGTLFSQVNARLARPAEDPDRTAQALMAAKEALIAYAVMNDDQPGELPCPDWNNDGVLTAAGVDLAGSICTAQILNLGVRQMYSGWLPYQALGLGEELDGSGARLWYAVSPAYARTAGPFVGLNSRTVGALTADGQGDIVAVIIAPGPPTAGQVRAGAPFDANADRASYLEAENADADTALAGLTVAGNDRIVAISRAELMGRVEKRVLREASNALRTYYDEWAAAGGAAEFRGSGGLGNGNFPVLAAYFDIQPATVIDTQFRQDLVAALPAEGLLTVHTGFDLLDDAGGGEGMEGGFTFLWNINNTTPVAANNDVTTGTAYDLLGGLNSVEDDDVRIGPLDPITILPSVNVASADGYCVWDPDGGPSRARCRMRPGATYVFPDPHPRIGEELVPGDPFTEVRAGSREYSFDINAVNGFYDSVDEENNRANAVRWPALAPRRERARDVTLDQTTPGQVIVITVTDQVTIDDDPVIGDPGDPTPHVIVDSSKSLTWVNGLSSAALLEVRRIPYRLDTVRNLPAYFEANDWHHLVYVVTAPSLNMGGGDNCVGANDCIDLLDSGGADTGRDLHLVTLAMRDRFAAGGTPSDFLELENDDVGASPRRVRRSPPSALTDDTVAGVEFDWSVP